MLAGEVEYFDQLKYNIKSEDLHEKGFEKNPHITLLFGLKVNDFNPNNINFDEFNFSDILIDEIGIFNTKSEFDVLKISINSESVCKANKQLCFYPYYSEFPDFIPHITIGYFKKGQAKKYIDQLNKFVDNIKFKPTSIIWSVINLDTKKYKSTVVKTF
jgi:2'-5' RNA ligase